jgi:hypothetical protein
VEEQHGSDRDAPKAVEPGDITKIWMLRTCVLDRRAGRESRRRGCAVVVVVLERGLPDGQAFAS